ncbi:hypothetical protein M885DRAFT_473085, partial [Pelagophyceae sp. CCMP2097]
LAGAARGRVLAARRVLVRQRGGGRAAGPRPRRRAPAELRRVARRRAAKRSGRRAAERSGRFAAGRGRRGRRACRQYPTDRPGVARRVGRRAADDQDGIGPAVPGL